MNKFFLTEHDEVSFIFNNFPEKFLPKGLETRQKFENIRSALHSVFFVLFFDRIAF